MLSVRSTVQFKKDLKKAAKQRRNHKKVEQVLEVLARPEPLPPAFKDHRLKGVWKDFRECHIEADWLLIYLISDFELRPTRLGTHKELFE
ncbi:MAG: type II toxin-antitoxin system YafQ family toxin [Thermodesulfobacteriota bacterium]